MEAVLGPSLPGPYSQHHIPIEMAVHNEKSRPGSGQLAVKVSMDGPTRVLCITDVTQQVTAHITKPGHSLRIS